MWRTLVVLGALLGAAAAYAADTPTDVGTGFTSSNPAGQVSGLSLTLADNNGATTPAANRLRIRPNNGLGTPPTCLNQGAAGFVTILDIDNGAGLDWVICIGTAEAFDIPDTGSDVIGLAQLLVGTGAGTGNYVSMSGGATIDQTGLVTLNEAQLLFQTVHPSSGQDVVADTTTDTLTATGTSPITITGTAASDTLVWACPTCNVSAADITDVWACTTGNCNALTGAAGDSLDAGSADSISPAARSTTLPATCTEGNAYQDTDSGGTEFYICTATNTWTKTIAATDSVAAANLWGATDASNDAGSAGQVCRATGANACTWGALAYTDLTGAPTIAFTATGTSGSSQTISNGDTLTIAAGSGITTTGGATDTITIAAVDTSATNEINTLIGDSGTATDALAATIGGGAGIVTSSSSVTDKVTVTVDSTKADFLTSGALTCGAATQGKMKVHTTPLQYCDNAATPALQYAAYGTNAGLATGVKLPAATDGLSSTTSSGSGLENLSASAGLALLQGCADGEILKWNETADTWGCAADSGTAPAFSAITSGSNTSATMTVGSGASLITTAGLFRLPNSATGQADMTSSCTVGDIKQDTGLGAGNRLQLCVSANTPVGIDNPFGSEIDANELANTLALSGAQVFDFNTNHASLKLNVTTSDPAAAGTFVVNDDSAASKPLYELEWYAGSALRGLVNYAILGGRPAGQTILGGNTNNGTDDQALSLGGSGAANDTSRGAYISLAGNENTFGGVAVISAGSTAGVFDGVYLVSPGGTLSLMDDGDVCSGIGLGSESSCTRSLGFLGTAARTIGLERNTTAATGGQGLTVNAGAATSTTTDKDGGTLTLDPGGNTGTGRSLVSIGKYTSATSTGTGNGTRLDGAVFGGFKGGLTSATPTAVANFTLASNTSVGTVVHYSVQVSDGASNHIQNETGIVVCSVINSNGTILAGGTSGCTIQGTPVKTVTASGGGTLTVAWTMTAANPAVLTVTVTVGTITATTGYPRVQYNFENLTNQAVAVQ